MTDTDTRENSVRTKFIIFSVARSGTSFLTTSLRSHPEILCHGEALLPRHFEKHVFGSAQQELSQAMCETEPLKFAHRLFELNDGFPIVGFKLFAAHSRPAHKPLLHDRSIKKIVLRRSNALASYSSVRIAQSTGRWNSKAPVKRDAKTTFERDKFESYRDRLEKYFAAIDKHCAGDRLNITYEDDIMGANVKPILEFLGADSDFETNSDKVKLLGRSIVDRFENADVVAAYLDEIGKPEWGLE